VLPKFNHTCIWMSNFILDSKSLSSYDSYVPYKDPEDQKRAARAHYKAHKEDYLRRARAWNKEQKLRIRELLHSAKDVPCTDCAVKYPFYVMQFDHLRDKEFTIGTLVNRAVPIERIRKEIAKCEVVCANCHAERTWQRGQRFRGE